MEKNNAHTTFKPEHDSVDKNEVQRIINERINELIKLEAERESTKEQGPLISIRNKFNAIVNHIKKEVLKKPSNLQPVDTGIENDDETKQDSFIKR